MKIPRLAERLDAMVYRRKLELDVAEIKPDLDMVRKAAAEIRVSANFKAVLSVCDVLTSNWLCLTFCEDCFGRW